MKQTIYIISVVSLVIIAFFGVFFVVIMGFMWLDRKYPAKPIVENPDKVACRNAGGIPITSAWDGRILDCKLIK